LPNITGMIKPRRTRMRNKRNAQKVLVENLMEIDLLEDLGINGNVILK
jgi:hypothetical protein